MEFWIYPLLVLAGFMAGFINTLAGAGSVVSLALFPLFLNPTRWLEGNPEREKKRVGLIQT